MVDTFLGQFVFICHVADGVYVWSQAWAHEPASRYVGMAWHLWRRIGIGWRMLRVERVEPYNAMSSSFLPSRHDHVSRTPKLRNTTGGVMRVKLTQLFFYGA